MYDLIDLSFQGFPAIIASYVLRGPRGVAVIETGPASTYPALKAGLANLGMILEKRRANRRNSIRSDRELLRLLERFYRTAPIIRRGP